MTQGKEIRVLVSDKFLWGSYRSPVRALYRSLFGRLIVRPNMHPASLSITVLIRGRHGAVAIFIDTYSNRPLAFAV